MSASYSLLYVENQRDDDELNLLTSQGFTVQIAKTAKEARDCLLREEYDAVLLDIMLEPGKEALEPEKIAPELCKGVPSYMGGVTVLWLIKQGKYKGADEDKILPVVVYTAVALQQVKDVIDLLLEKQEKHWHIEKPAGFKVVITALKRAIIQSRGTS